MTSTSNPVAKGDAYLGAIIDFEAIMEGNLRAMRPRELVDTMDSNFCVATGSSLQNKRHRNRHGWRAGWKNVHDHRRHQAHDHAMPWLPYLDCHANPINQHDSRRPRS
ncbi:hypothetical protein ACFQY0_17085 [Haloferula chungangensis]|uniref:Uncharacterized protein n=1 Tax=Haloferula chungangensis TaxID=1048331 RepID=A0ABW2LC41_9BACT